MGRRNIFLLQELLTVIALAVYFKHAEANQMVGASDCIPALRKRLHPADFTLQHSSLRPGNKSVWCELLPGSLV